MIQLHLRVWSIYSSKLEIAHNVKDRTNYVRSLVTSHNAAILENLCENTISLILSPHSVCKHSVIMMSIKIFFGTRYLRFVISNDSLFCSAMCFDNTTYLSHSCSVSYHREYVYVNEKWFKISKTPVLVGKTNESNIKKYVHISYVIGRSFGSSVGFLPGQMTWLDLA